MSSPGSAEQEIESLCRELGDQRMKQALDQTLQAVAAMGLVVTALSRIVEGTAVMAEADAACEHIRMVRTRVERLRDRLERNGGPRVTRHTAESEQRRRLQQA